MSSIETYIAVYDSECNKTPEEVVNSLSFRAIAHVDLYSTENIACIELATKAVLKFVNASGNRFRMITVNREKLPAYKYVLVE